MFIIRDISDYTELEYCIQLAIDQTTGMYFDIDPSYVLNRAYTLLKIGSMFKVIEYNREIVAWGGAKIVSSGLYCKKPEVIQLIYQTKVKGILAVRSLILFQRAMIEYAIEHNVGVCVASSMMDNYKTFNKVL